MYAQTNSTRRNAASFLATFGYAWLMIGLFTGTVVLVLFVRGIINALHDVGLGQTAENRVLLGVMVLFLVASFLLTRNVVRRLYRTQSLWTRRIALGALVVPGALSMWAWSNPTRLLAGIAGGERTALKLTGGAEFVFGPYPDATRLAELKRQGFDAVVSLQHPAVLVEMQGINAEKSTARELGLKVIQAPMLPWVSDNASAVATIRQLAMTGRGRYYIHCGLGRDRVNVAKRVIQAVAESRENVRLATTAGTHKALGLKSRVGGVPFQRGRIFALGSDDWLMPLPNAEEFHAHVVQGDQDVTLFVLDPSDSTQRAWLTKNEPSLKTYAIRYAVVPFGDTDAKDSTRVAALIDRIHRERGVVVVVTPATPFGPGPEPRTAVAVALLHRLGVSLAPTPATSPSSSLQSAYKSGK